MSIHFVTGDDPVLREHALGMLITELVGDDDRELAVEEHTVPGRAGEGDGPGGAEGRELAVTAALHAAQSPPFMAARRVVVLRDAGNLAAADAERLVAYLDDPMETTELVLVAGGGRLPAVLTKAWKGRVTQHGPASEKGLDVLAGALAEANLHLRNDAAKAVADHVGGDVGRIPAIVEVLAAAHPAGATLGVDDVLAYLGAPGAVPPWQLTNAIEAGDVAGVLDVLQRLRAASGMHALQVMGLLHSYFRRLLRLDDPAIDGAADAVAALGGRMKEYPAKKALGQARTLGTRGIRRAYDLLAAADRDLKGSGRAIPDDVVIEILVARLAALSGPGGRRGR